MSQKLIRLGSDGFVKPLNTLQEKLTQEDINNLLEEYEQVEDLNDLKTGTHVRYFDIVLNNEMTKKLFRMGGTIIKLDLEKEYMVLSNGKLTWSVQLKNKIIYKKMTTEEVKQFYENELDNRDIEIKQLKYQIDKLKNNIKKQQQTNEQYYEIIKKLQKNKN